MTLSEVRQAIKAECDNLRGIFWANGLGFDLFDLQGIWEVFGGGLESAGQWSARLTTEESGIPPAGQGETPLVAISRARETREYADLRCTAWATCSRWHLGT